MKGRSAARLLIYTSILLFLFSSAVYAAPLTETPVIKAPSAILVEAERGQVLYEKEPQKQLHISSACKLMTILIAAESGDLNSNVTVSKESVDSSGSALSLEVGEKYTLEDLLYGIMLTSANDAAKAVAEYIAGDTGKFVIKMNEMAAKLNMKNTHFTNPTGLLDDTQYTTAYDISLLIKYAVKNPAFNRIFSVHARPWVHQNGDTQVLTSQNKLFYSYDGVDGGKTGYNNKDQQTVIVTAARGNMKLIGIILDSPEESLFTDATLLLDHGFDEFKKTILVNKDDKLKTVQVQGTEINLISHDDVYYVHPVGESYIKEFNIAENLQQPINKSKLAGTARYTLNDDTVIDVGIYPDAEIKPPENFYTTAKMKILENKDILILVLFLLLIEAILIIVNLIKLIKKIVRKVFKIGNRQPKNG